MKNKNGILWEIFGVPLIAIMVCFAGLGVAMILIQMVILLEKINRVTEENVEIERNFPIIVSDEIKDYDYTKYQVEEELALLPIELQEEFADSPYVLDVEPKDDTLQYAGYINRYSEKIVIMENYIQWATLHEIGHFIDEGGIKYSSSEEFRRAYANEYPNFKENYHVPSELFAETFKQYYQGTLESKELNCYFDNTFGK